MSSFARELVLVDEVGGAFTPEQEEALESRPIIESPGMISCGWAPGRRRELREIEHGFLRPTWWATGGDRCSIGMIEAVWNRDRRVAMARAPPPGGGSNEVRTR